MTIITGINNQGVTIKILICGEYVEIPPGKFVIKKDEYDKFYADRPAGIGSNIVGPDLGLCDIVSNTTTMIAGIDQFINITQYNNLIDNVVGSTPEIQGLWLSAGIDETFSAWAESERVIGGSKGIKFDGNNNVLPQGNMYLLNCDFESSFRINIIPNQPGGIVAFTMDDMFNISINDTMSQSSIELNNKSIINDFYENRFISKLIVILNGLNTKNFAPKFSNIIVDNKIYNQTQLDSINNIFDKAWKKGCGKLTYENLKDMALQSIDKT
jgi:hypothetical protein